MALEIKYLVSRQAKYWRRTFNERYDFDIHHWLNREPTDWSSLPQGRNPRGTDEIVECALAYTFWECARRFTLYMERVSIEFGVDRYLAVCVGFIYLICLREEPADWLGYG